MSQPQSRPAIALLSAAALAAFATSVKAGAEAPEAFPPPANATTDEFTGAELYSMECSRCHAERYPAEHTDAQWKTIMLHMRSRAQLPASTADAILQYLQENN